jgi:hypothetical protein
MLRKELTSKKGLKGSQDEELMETLFLPTSSGGLNNLVYKIHQNLLKIIYRHCHKINLRKQWR